MLITSLLPLLVSPPALGAPAQSPIGIKALDALVAALNARSATPLQPFLTSATRVGGLDPAFTTQVLAQVLGGAKPVEAVGLVRRTSEGTNVRVVLRLVREGKAEERDFLLDPEGRFLEINLIKATVKRIDGNLDDATADAPDRIAVGFRLAGGLVLVSASVDGAKGEFVLDTGAPTLALNGTRFAPPAGEATLGSGTRGVNGAIAGGSYHRLRSFDWSGLRLAEREVATYDLSAIERRVGRPVMGLIGYGLLKRYALTLDYPAHRLVLAKPGARDVGATTFPLTMRAHLPTARFDVGGESVVLGLDTGAQNDLLDQSYAERFDRLLRNRRKVDVVGAEGRPTPTLKGVLPEIRIGESVRFRDQDTVFSRVAAFAEGPGKPRLDGLAGYPLLRRYRTTIDYVNGTVRFDPL